MRLDAHQHFWRYHPDEYLWMTEAMAGLKRDYLPEDLRPLLEQAGVQGSLAVQARQTLRETEWLLQLADQHDFIKGVVGWVDLQSPQVSEQLARFAQHPRLVGVRHVVHDEPDDDFLLRPAFQRGLAALAEFDLAYDLLLFPRHLPVAVQVARRFPRQRFVLDHLAKPLIKAQVTAPWEADVRALAQCENVCCKVSGLVTEAAWGQWQAADFRRYLDIALEAFGVDRLLFGSDWPVCTLSAGYAQVVELVRDYLGPFSAESQAKILGGNAAVFYRIDNA